MNVEQIWAEYKAVLKAFLHSKVSNPADVEDLLQEILIKTHNNLSNLKKQSSIKSWLFQIANNSIIDFYRKKGGTQLFDEDMLWMSENDVSIKTELSACIAPFINALPQENALLLTAIDIENRSQKAYAEELGISYSTLKSRVQKSRTLLKAVFDNCCQFQLDAVGNVYDYVEKKQGCGDC